MIDQIERLKTEIAEAVAGLRPDVLSAADADRVLAALTSITDVAFGGSMLVMARAVEGESLHVAKERLARRSGMSAGEAESLVKASASLEGLPVVADALRAGRLSRAQARLVVEAAAEVPAAQSELLGAAASEDLKGLRDRCARVRANADRDPSATRSRQHKARFLRTWTDRDGCRRGAWSLPPDVAAEVESALDAWTDRVFTKARRAGDREPFEAYRADALLAMARAAIRVRRVPSRRHAPDGSLGRPPSDGDHLDDEVPLPIAKELVLHVDVSTIAAVLGGAQDHLAPDREGRVCEVRGVGPVAPEVAAAWMGDAFLKAILQEGRDVRIVKHFGRNVPAELLTALRRLHPVCRDPGCNKCRRLETDHIAPDALDGPLSLANAGPTCTASHRAKTKTDITAINAARAAGHQKMTKKARASLNAANRKLSYDPDPSAYARHLARERAANLRVTDPPSRRADHDDPAPPVGPMCADETTHPLEVLDLAPA